MKRPVTSREQKQSRLRRLDLALHRERGSGLQRLMCEAAVVVLLVVVVVSAFQRNFVGVFGFGLPLLVGIGWLVSRDIRRRLERGVEWLDSMDLVWHLLLGLMVLGTFVWSFIRP